MGIEEDADLTVDTDAGTTGNQNTLTFTTTNWSTPQTVRVYAAEDADSLGGRARLSHAPWSTDVGYSNISVAGVTVIEMDNDGAAPGAITNLVAETIQGTYTLRWTQPERATDIQFRRERVEDDDDCDAALSDNVWSLFATPSLSGRTWAAPGGTSASLFRTYPAPGYTGTRANPVLPDPGKLCYELRARNGNVPGDAASVIVYPETTASAIGVYMDHSSEFDNGADLGKKTPHNNDSRRYVTEGGQVDVRVSLTKAAPTELVIPLWRQVSSSKPAETTDHDLPLRSSITIPAGQRSATKRIITYCDTDTEQDVFTVGLRDWDFPVSVVSGGGSSSTNVLINEPSPASTTCSGGGGGMSGPQTAEARRAPSTPPGVVTNIAVTHTGSSLTVTWDAPTGATHYDVTYYNTTSGDNARAAWDYEDTSLTITCDVREGYENQHCVSGGASYTVGVRAKNAGGASAWVNSETAALALPAAVTDITVVHYGTVLAVEWEAVSGATHYDVTYYNTSSGVNARAA